MFNILDTEKCIFIYTAMIITLLTSMIYVIQGDLIPSNLVIVVFGPLGILGLFAFIYLRNNDIEKLSNVAQINLGCFSLMVVVTIGMPMLLLIVDMLL